jgi:type VI secretion system protein VasD
MTPGLCLLAMAFLLGGCASSQGPSTLDKSLEWLGVSKPNLPPAELAQVDRSVPLRIHAGDVLNTDANGKSLSVVVKIYKLREAETFLSAAAGAFKSADAERSALGGSVVDTRELVLTPGQKYEVIETLSPQISHLAVVAQFRTPAEGRWRFVFASRAAERSGITLGVHGCAISVAAGEPLNTPPELLRLAGAQCR